MLGLKGRVVGKNDLVEHNWSIVSNSAWFEKFPIWATPTSARNSSKSRLSFTFTYRRRFAVEPNFEKFCVGIVFIDHQICQKPCCSTCWLFSSLHFPKAHFWMSNFNLVIYEGNRSVSCDVQRYYKYGYIARHRLCCLHATYHHSELRYTVIMGIWDVDVQQRQRYLNWAKLCYIMSNKLSYLLASIVLLSQDTVTIIFTVKFKINKTAFTIKDCFEGQSNWNMD